ncbi:hypothetical protein E2C01_028451 [Portunus trituberculatus]|uniref:Uncharacterized protein n=1 Tax=Portunus trituberculatus TaxID=210409 RepID=A0A5B7ELK8_PORTR|nr:hypothetical protein [Portunus trituberculatus]
MKTQLSISVTFENSRGLTYRLPQHLLKGRAQLNRLGPGDASERGRSLATFVQHLASLVGVRRGLLPLLTLPLLLVVAQVAEAPLPPVMVRRTSCFTHRSCNLTLSMEETTLASTLQTI